MVSNDSEAAEVKVIVPVNIALIKYWGKRDEDLILPLNDSLSLSINDVYAETRLRVGPSIADDSVSINGCPVDLGKQTRFAKCFAEVRRMVRKRFDVGDEKVAKAHCFSKFEFVSETSFPVGAGLASSAAGFAAIAFALGQLFHLDNNEVVRIARLGSGSACRSVLDGFVHWKAGTSKDGSDCFCESVVSSKHWPSLRAIILVTSKVEKDVCSTNGMQSSVDTSELMKYRVEHVVPARVQRLIKAIKECNFEELAKVTMAESNQLHAICLDTAPPLKYLNENSWRLIRLVNALNASFGALRVAYTFDAGPNCCLFLEADAVPATLAAIKKYCHLPCDVVEQLVESAAGREWPDLRKLLDDEEKKIQLKNIETFADIVQDAFLSRVGAGPHVIAND